MFFQEDRAGWPGSLRKSVQIRRSGPPERPCVGHVGCPQTVTALEFLKQAGPCSGRWRLPLTRSGAGCGRLEGGFLPATAVQQCARWSSPDLEPGVLSPGLCTSVSSVFGQVQLIPPFQNMLVFREIGRLDQVTFLSLPFPSHLKENKLVLNLVNTCLVSVKMSYLKINIIDDFKDFYYMKNLGLCTSREDDSVRNLRVPSTTCDDDQFTADLVCPVPPPAPPSPPPLVVLKQIIRHHSMSLQTAFLQSSL